MSDNMIENKKQQWKKRVDTFRYIYSILNGDEEKMSTSTFDDRQNQIIDYFNTNIDEISDLIKALISKGWTWERTKVIDKAIIMQAYCENKAIGTDKKICIDQAIINAKNYSDINSYKFVNAILDKIIK
ncbi:MAG: transcription antitermination factor NusB [Mycoplasmoidaceae bacterium]|nr:MAG: transcription antitermination factor NusB [Mycoplasmoidaceae bacterium]